VSAEVLQKNIEQMGRQIKTLQKDLEAFPPPQNERDLFSEKMSISFTLLPSVLMSPSSSPSRQHDWKPTGHRHGRVASDFMWFLILYIARRVKFKMPHVWADGLAPPLVF
jgi:hypothetical protein